MDGTPGVTKQGNSVLVDYGIAQEHSDIRAHVSVTAQAVYVYPTKLGLAAIATGKHKQRPAFTGDICTAVGYLVPPAAIRQCRKIVIPPHIFAQADFCERDSATAKGQKAVRVVRWLLRSGLFPLWAEPTIVADVDMQVDGMDILVAMRARIQVKCDWRAGDGDGCTGNLFLQVQECNPYRQT